MLSELNSLKSFKSMSVWRKTYKNTRLVFYSILNIPIVKYIPRYLCNFDLKCLKYNGLTVLSVRKYCLKHKSFLKNYTSPLSGTVKLNTSFLI